MIIWDKLLEIFLAMQSSLAIELIMLCGVVGWFDDAG